MIDKTLVRMIDETLREVPQLSLPPSVPNPKFVVFWGGCGFGSEVLLTDSQQNEENFRTTTLAKMLEVRANQAHLVGSPICGPSSQCQGFSS
jgi:hypothetical protein